MADQSILISTVLPASLMPFFYGQLTSELGNFEHWPFTTVWENGNGYFEQWELLIRDCCVHNMSLHSQTDRHTYLMTGMELSHGRAWARDWLRAAFPRLAKDFQLSSKIKVSAQISRWVFRMDWSHSVHLGNWKMSDISTWEADERQYKKFSWGVAHVWICEHNSSDIWPEQPKRWMGWRQMTMWRWRLIFNDEMHIKNQRNNHSVGGWLSFIWEYKGMAAKTSINRFKTIAVGTTFEQKC